ncbi:hypothetical protein KAW80_04600 [Candidatus Babeliales bacterium]|nr:hypothetical protein [Candidatus Babeliales bacterium]
MRLIISLLILNFFVSLINCDRNPFLPPKIVQKNNLRLSGIIKLKQNYSGILDDGSKTHIVFKGSQINDYFINDIGSDFIMFSCNGITQKLALK